MRIAIYARKSTESEDRQIQSLEDQIAALTMIAERENLRVVSVFQEARSAKAPGTRSEFERLMGEVEAGRIEGILTWSISRLSRNPVDGGRVAYLLQTRRLQIIRTPERTYRPEDNALLLSIENEMATAYLQDLSRNVARGMASKAERGWHVCKAPVGYRNDPVSREITVDTARFALVRMGWDRLLSGNQTIGQIHRELVRLGLNVQNRRRVSPPISRARLHTVFRDRFYAGEIPFRGKYIPGKHKPMLTQDEFETAQRILSNYSRERKSNEPNRLPFHGKLICGTCGCIFVGEKRVKRYPRTGRTAEYVYYHCSGSKGCSKIAIREEDLIAATAPLMQQVRVPRSLGDWLKLALIQRIEAESVSTAEQEPKVRHQIQNEERRLKELQFMRLDGELTSSEYLQLKNELERRLDSLHGKLEAVCNRVSLALNLLSKKIDAAVKINELLSEPNDPNGIGLALKVAESRVLTLSPFDFRIDPILAKIATFEPARAGSESPIPGDYVPLNSVWWSLVDDLRTQVDESVRLEDLHERESKLLKSNYFCGEESSGRILPL
ncbi:MAG: recombinase family protein [Armatimonadetes bacterium]|nr:recombinase family protein [Armatimonadota bacterium]